MYKSEAGNSDKKRFVPTLAEASAYFKQYCRLTAIHVVRYLAEDRLYLIEK